MQAMALEPKKQALHLLVEKGFLTESEYTKCIEAISGTEETSKTWSIQLGEKIYQDSMVEVRLQKITDEQFFMHGGPGHGFVFLVKNKTNKRIDYFGTNNIAVNGVIIESYGKFMIEELDPQMQAVGEVSVNYRYTELAGIKRPEDFHDIRFSFVYKLTGEFQDRHSEGVDLSLRQLMSGHQRVK